MSLYKEKTKKQLLGLRVRFYLIYNPLRNEMFKTYFDDYKDINIKIYIGEKIILVPLNKYLAIS